MAKRTIPLRKKYGKLTVVNDFTQDGARMVEVSCECGATKTVQAYSLYKGRTKSCGMGLCKQYARVKPDAEYKPQPPRAYTVKQAQRWWGLYTHPDQKKRMSIPQIAAKEKVNVNTMYAMFRAVAKCGGFDNYLKAVTPKWPKNATTRKNTGSSTASPSRSPTAASATPPGPVPRKPARSAKATARKSTTSSR